MSNVRKPKAARDLVAEVAAAQSAGRRLPRGNSSLPKALTQDTQRIRLYYGLAASLVEKGYAATTLSDITRHAGVSRATFYELFEDKEDCFLGGFRIMAGIHLKSVRDAMALAEHPADRCSRALAAYLERIDDHPALAVAFFAEAEAASPSIRDALERMQAEWVELIASVADEVRAVHPEVARPTEHTIHMLVAGLRRFAVHRARHGAEAQGEGAQELTRFTFGALGLYGWAARVGQAGNWGGPLR